MAKPQMIRLRRYRDSSAPYDRRKATSSPFLYPEVKLRSVLFCSLPRAKLLIKVLVSGNSQPGVLLRHVARTGLKKPEEARRTVNVMLRRDPPHAPGSTVAAACKAQR